MKKLAKLSLSLLMVFSLSACDFMSKITGGNKDSSSETSDNTNTNTNNNGNSNNNTTPPDDSGNTGNEGGNNNNGGNSDNNGGDSGNQGGETGNNEGGNNQGGDNGQGGEVTPPEDPGLTIAKINAGLQALITANNYTMSISTISNDVEEDGFEYKGKEVPVYEKSSTNIVFEVDGKKSKTTLSYSTESTINITEAVTILEAPRELVVTGIKQSAFQQLTYMYGSTMCEENKENDTLTMTTSMGPVATYTNYDENAKQYYSFQGGSSTYLTDNDFGIEAMMNDQLENGRIENDILYLTEDGEETQLTFEFDGVAISKVTMRNENAKHNISTGEYTFTKVGETTMSLPEEMGLPKCDYAKYLNHDEHTSYRYYPTKEGHRKVCSECGKFLDDDVQEHVHEHNELGMCEVCAYITDNEAVVPQGFENGTDRPFLKVVETEKVFVISQFGDYYSSMVFDMSIEGVNRSAYFFPTEKAILISNRTNTQKIAESCIETSNQQYLLFKNIPNEKASKMSQYYNYGDEFKEYCHDLVENGTPDATYSKVTIAFHHTASTTPNSYKVNDCVTINNTLCSGCGELIYHDVSIHHTYGEEEITTIDGCHKYHQSECTVCHEKNRGYTSTNHSYEGDPIKESVVLDSCHKLVYSYCPTCHELLKKEVVAEHGTNTKTINETVDSCTTKIMTICLDCEMVIDEELESDHTSITQVVCGYDELDDYGVNISPISSESKFTFSYCTACHKPVGNIVNEYLPYTNISHQTIDYYFEHYLDTHTSHYTNGAFDHICGDDHICVLCGAYVLDVKENVQFVIEYEDGNWSAGIFNDVTKEFLSIYAFDCEQHGNDNYYLYTSNDYEGISIKELFEDNGDISGYEIIYDNGSKSMTFSSNMFPLN